MSKANYTHPPVDKWEDVPVGWLLFRGRLWTKSTGNILQNKTNFRNIPMAFVELQTGETIQPLTLLEAGRLIVDMEKENP